MIDFAKTKKDVVYIDSKLDVSIRVQRVYSNTEGMSYRITEFNFRGLPEIFNKCGIEYSSDEIVVNNDIIFRRNDIINTEDFKKRFKILKEAIKSYKEHLKKEATEWLPEEERYFDFSIYEVNGKIKTDED